MKQKLPFNQAKYLNGEPQNLIAAANDALEWLKFWQEHLKQAEHSDENHILLRRQRRAIEALETFLPKETPAFEKMPLYDAVAELAISSLEESK